MANRLASLFAITALLISCHGCSRSTRTIEGEISLDGKPLASGVIEFEPIDKSIAPFGAEIQNGRYSVEISPQKAGGQTVVRVSSPQPTGRRIPAGPPAPTGQFVDEIMEMVPAIYNTETNLKVALDSPGPHNFKLATVK